MNFRISFLFAFLLFIDGGSASEEKSLGKSPDKEWEVFLVAEDADDLGTVVIRNLKTLAEIETESGPGWGTFAESKCTVVWKESSDAFAYDFRGTKRTFHTDLYFLSREKWEKADFPPFVMNILGRQGVFEVGRGYVEGFDRFLKDNQFVLICHIVPDWEQLEKAAKSRTWKPSTQVDWQVTLQYRPGNVQNCGIVGISEYQPPKEKSGKE